MLRIISACGLLGFAIGLVGYGLQAVFSRDATGWHITFVIVGVLVLVVLGFWIRSVKHDARAKESK